MSAFHALDNTLFVRVPHFTNLAITNSIYSPLLTLLATSCSKPCLRDHDNGRCKFHVPHSPASHGRKLPCPRLESERTALRVYPRGRQVEVERRSASPSSPGASVDNTLTYALDKGGVSQHSACLYLLKAFANAFPELDCAGVHSGIHTLSSKCHATISDNSRQRGLPGDVSM